MFSSVRFFFCPHWATTLQHCPCLLRLVHGLAAICATLASGTWHLAHHNTHCIGSKGLGLRGTNLISRTWGGWQNAAAAYCNLAPRSTTISFSHVADSTCLMTWCHNREGWVGWVDLGWVGGGQRDMITKTRKWGSIS